MNTRFLLLLLFVAVFLGLVVSVSHSRAAQPLSASLAAHPLDHHALQIANDWEHKFRLTSDTFENDGQIPPSMVFNGQLGSTLHRHQHVARSRVEARPVEHAQLCRDAV